MKIIERLYKIIPATFPRFHISIERWKFNKEYEVCGKSADVKFAPIAALHYKGE